MATSIWYDISIDGDEYSDGSQGNPFGWINAFDPGNSYNWNGIGDVDFYVRGIRHLTSGSVSFGDTCGMNMRWYPWDLSLYGPWRIGIDSGTINWGGYETFGYSLDGAILKANTVNIGFDEDYFGMMITRSVILADDINFYTFPYLPYNNSYFYGNSFIANNSINFSASPAPYQNNYIDCIFKFTTASNLTSTNLFSSCAMPTPITIVDGTVIYDTCRTDWVSPVFPAWNDTNPDHWAQSILAAGMPWPPENGHPNYSGYDTGLFGEPRTGIGGLYFDTTITTTTGSPTTTTTGGPTTTTAPSMDIGFVHISWPTHKYLLLLLEDGTLFKAYIDSPLDTIYDTGDFLTKYDIICRNVSVANKELFPDWNKFDGFKRFNGLDLEGCILELINFNPYIDFGSYFPSDFQNLNITTTTTTTPAPTTSTTTTTTSP
jgi:hypothetical protein